MHQNALYALSRLLIVKLIPLLQTLLYELFKPLYGDGRFLSAFMVRLHLQKASCEHPHSLLSEAATKIELQIPL